MCRKMFYMVAILVFLAGCAQPLLETGVSVEPPETVQSKGVMRYLAKAYIFIRLPWPYL